jgi:hypothetical protein
VNVLDQFREHRVMPVLKNGRLKLLAVDVTSITPPLISLVKEHKAEIIEALAIEDAEESKRYASAFEVELAKARAEGNDYFTSTRIAEARASEGDGGYNDAMTARIAALDVERNEQDRQRRYGYDYDESAPSRAGYIWRKDKGV